MKKKYFITGGMGFLGTKLSQSLSINHEVIIYDNLSRNRNYDNLEFNKNVKLVEGDISDINLLKKSIDDSTDLIHLAYINGTRYFYEKPELVIDVALNGINSILELCDYHSFDKLIYASTSEVYNEPQKIPTDEREPLRIPDVLNPRFSYSGGKIFGELVFINKFRNAKSNFLKIFRPHNIFGENMGSEHVIPALVKKILISKVNNNHISIDIQGTGKEKRSFCYIDDAVNQISLIANDQSDEIIYNIGNSDNYYSVSELINFFEKIFDIKIAYNISELTLDSPKFRCPNIEKIENLGFKSKKSFIEDLAKTTSWYKDFYNI